MHLKDVNQQSSRCLQPNTSPPDPWTFMGPKGRYRFSNYRNPSVRLGWLATFLMTCMGDVFEATARQGFKPDQPYPGGIYNCHLRYYFPCGSSVTFVLEMTKTEAPDWSMTFSNIADDLEALWYAALWFEGRAAGFPEADFEVYRLGQRSNSFLACRGNFKFAFAGTANANSA